MGLGLKFVIVAVVGCLAGIVAGFAPLPAVWAVVLTSVVTCVLALVWVQGALSRELARLSARVHTLGRSGSEPPAAIDAEASDLASLARELDALDQRLIVARARARDEVTQRVNALSRVGDNERLLSVGKLSSGIAHEFGTPLNVITGRAQIILADEPEGSENAKNARIIVEQTKRITKIIRSLQEFANPRPLQKASVDLRSAASQALLTLAPLAERHEAALDVEEGEPLRAPVDVVQFQKALVNLVTNAVHASRGGGRVSLHFRTDTVQPPVLRDGTLGPRAPYAIIDVRDTGHGMSPEIVARVFEPFFTTREVGEGTGLGLSLTHGIVREHGGFIHVSSAPSVGTTFSIHLPLAE